jgi:Tat protein translocase TatB subunit
LTLLFFDFGSGEILLIVLVAFLIFGPDKIPEMARNIGKFINEVKRASEDIKTEINREADKKEREKKLAEYEAKLDLKPKDVSTADSKIVNENTSEAEEVNK